MWCVLPLMEVLLLVQMERIIILPTVMNIYFMMRMELLHLKQEAVEMLEIVTC